MASAADLFHGLAGRWDLDRVIEPGIGKVTGTAVLSPAGPDRLHYREDVELRLATGYVSVAYRDYDYQLEDGRIRILFADGLSAGETMHVLSLSGAAGSGLEAADSHLCRADLYTGHYAFHAEGGFTVGMTVTGPGKDYRMMTRYSRPVPE